MARSKSSKASGAVSAAPSKRVARSRAAKSPEVEPASTSPVDFHEKISEAKPPATTSTVEVVPVQPAVQISHEPSLGKLLLGLVALIAVATGFFLQPAVEPAPAAPVAATLVRHTNQSCLEVLVWLHGEDDATAFERTFPQLVHRTRRAVCVYAGVDVLEKTGRRLEALLRRHTADYTIFEASLPSNDATPAQHVAALVGASVLAGLRELIVLAPEALVFSDLSKLWLTDGCKRVRAGQEEAVASVPSGDSGVLCVNLERARCLRETPALATLPNHFNCHGLANESLSQRCVLDGGDELRHMTARCTVMRWNGGGVRPWLRGDCSFHRHYWPLTA